jgi:hypothetical protein
MKILLAILLLVGSLSAQIGGSSSMGGTSSVGNAVGGATVATPTFSTAGGTVSPGTTFSISDSTSGAEIFYTWDSTSPSYQTFNNLDYAAGTSSMWWGSYVPTLSVYKTRTFKAFAHKAGMTDSAVASVTYTLPAASGTAVSSCGNLTAASTTYYLSTDISSTGTCLWIEANNINLNMNGHTLTFGTGDGAIVTGSNLQVTSGSHTVTASSGTPFSSCSSGQRIFIQDNTFLTMSTTINVCTSSTSVTITGTPSFTYSASTYQVYGPSPTFGIDCNAAITSDNCLHFAVFNGNITQSTNASPDSSPIQLGSPNGYNDNEQNIVSDLVINASQPEVNVILINYSGPSSTYGNLVAFNTINDTSTVVYNRDELLGFPIALQNGNQIAVTSPASYVINNTVNGSPQGGALAQEYTIIYGNQFSMGPTQFVAGYCAFISSYNSIIVANNCSGNTRGWEDEAGGEIDGTYGVRFKDYGVSYNTLAGITFQYNYVNVTTAGCPAQGVKWTINGSTDGGIFENNDIIVNMASNNGYTSVYAEDQSNMTGWTISNNVYSKTGTYSANIYDAYFGYDGGTHWTISNLVSPRIFNQATAPIDAPTSAPTTGTFLGTGSATCSDPGGIASYTITYNGSSLGC